MLIKTNPTNFISSFKKIIKSDCLESKMFKGIISFLISTIGKMQTNLLKYPKINQQKE